jgi:hypothetical protein
MPKTSGCRWCRDTAPGGSPWPVWSRATSRVAQTTVARSSTTTVPPVAAAQCRHAAIRPRVPGQGGTRRSRRTACASGQLPRRSDLGTPYPKSSTITNRLAALSRARPMPIRRASAGPRRRSTPPDAAVGGADPLTRIHPRHGHPDHLGRIDRGAHWTHLRSAAVMTARRSALPAPGAG